MAERTLISFDYAVKYLLRSKADYGILSGFLSELMSRKVEVDDIIESESDAGPDPDAKTNRVDLKARIDGTEYVVFEIQFSREYDLLGRVLFGVSKAVTEQIKTGAQQYDIRKVYSVNIVYSNMTAKREYLFFRKVRRLPRRPLQGRIHPVRPSRRPKIDKNRKYPPGILPDPTGNVRRRTARQVRRMDLYPEKLIRPRRLHRRRNRRSQGQIGPAENDRQRKKSIRNILGKPR